MDVKLIIRQMKEKGMSDSEIRSNLEALGVSNAEEMIDSVGPSAQRAPSREAPESRASSEETAELVGLMRSLVDLNKKILKNQQDILSKLK